MKSFIGLAVLTLSLAQVAKAQDDLEKPELRTQNSLYVIEGARKIGVLPVTAVKRFGRMFTKNHSDFTKEFMKDKELQVQSFDEKNELFAYNQNYTSSKGEIFSFERLLQGEDYSQRSCAEVCPRSLEMLSLNLEQLKPVGENFLSFRNKAEDFTDSWEEHSGFCWGHSAVMDDFHYLGFFDEQNLLGAKIPSVKGDRVEFYKNLVDRIVLKGLPTVIPGYKNLREFSAIPEVKRYLKDRVALKWAKNAVVLKSFGNLTLDGGKMSLKRSKELIEQVKERVKSNQTPRIIFAALGDPSWSHVLNIYGVSKLPNGNHRLYVFETNYYPETIPYQSQFIEIDTDGNATYGPLALSRIKHNRVGKIKFTFEEESETVRYVNHLAKFCKAITNCK